MGREAREKGWLSLSGGRRWLVGHHLVYGPETHMNEDKGKVKLLQRCGENLRK